MKPSAAAAAALAQAREKRALVEDHVVGREHGDDRLRIALSGELRRDRDGGPGIAARRLEDDHRLRADFLELLAHEKAVVAIGDDDRLLEDRIADPPHGVLKGRGRADQGNELLGHRLARFRPDARARAPAHDDR